MLAPQVLRPVTLHQKKQVSIGEAVLDFAAVKAVATAYAVSVNDVLLSTFTGALRVYLRAMNEQVADMRVLLPVR
jgi:hypothetical protein